MPQTVDYPLFEGVDESSNSKLQPGPRLIRAENLRIVEKRMARKRRGTGLFANGARDSGSPTPVGPVRLATHNGQTLVLSEEGLWTVGASGARLEELDTLSATTLQSVVSLGHYGAANVVATACAETTAFRVFAWTTYDGTNYQLHIQTTDLDRGAGSAATAVTVTDPTQALRCLKAIALGSKVTVFWGEGTQFIRYVDITSATQGPFSGTVGTTLYSDAVQTSPQWFDVSPHESGYVMVYRNIAGASYKVKRLSSAHTEQNSGTFTPSLWATSPRFGIVGNANICVVVGSETDATALSVIWYDNTITELRRDTVLQSALGASGDVSGVACCAYSGSGAGAGDVVVNVQTTAADGYMSRIWVFDYSVPVGMIAGNRQWSTSLASKPWCSGNRVYGAVRYRTSDANSYIAVVSWDIESYSPRTRVARLEARFRDARAATPLDDVASTVSQTGSAVWVALTSVDRYSAPGVVSDPTGVSTVSADGTATGVQTVTYVGADAFAFEHARRDRWQAAQVGQYLCFAGGVVSAFDGRRCVEIGWASYPDVESSGLTASNTGSGAMANGTYAYGFTWGWLDWYGNRSQSALKVVEGKVLSGSNDTITLGTNALFRLSHTQKQWLLGGSDDRLPFLEIYRSTATGTLLFRLEGPGVTPFPENDLTAISAYISSYVDIYNDTTIALNSRELVYASSFGRSELHNMMPPPSNIICGHENRLFGVSAETPTVVWYTKQQFPGAALAWNGTLVIVFDTEVTAMVSQDGNLIVFSASRTYTVVGRPADNTGASTGYDPPQLLSGHIGCSNRRSVVSTPVGVFFQSVRGIELLPRGGVAPEFIGDLVRDTLEDFPIITAAIHNPATAEVLFACCDSETTGGHSRVLAFDYENKVWFVRNYQGKPISDMVIDGDDVVFGVYDSAAGLTLWKEDAGFDDANGGYVGTTWELGDIRHAKASGLQSFWSATILGEAVAPCMLKVEEMADDGTYDFNAQYQVSRSESDFARQYPVRQRKARKHRLRLSEVSTGTADTEGIAISMLTLELEPLGGASRLPNYLRG